MDICHLKNAELEAKHQKYKGRVVLRGDIVKDDSGSYAVFTEQGQQLYKLSTPCIDDHHFKEVELKSVRELSKVCSQIVLKCLHLARIGRPDILRSVNKLARSITKWTKARDKRLSRLISYIHHTCEYKQYCYVGNTAKQCRLGLFQDSDFAGDLEDSKSTSGGTLCVFGSHTFVPIRWMCKKQTSVSHSSTESEIISLDAGLRLDCIPALDLWDLIVAVLGNTNQSHKEQGDLLKNKREVCSPPHTIHKRKQSQRVINDLDNVFYFLKRQIFSSGSFVVCVWRHRSSDQNDDKGKKSDNETCFQNPQSCSWLVVRSNKFGTQNPNQIHWHQKTTRRHADQGKLHTWWMESSFVPVQH